MESVECRRDSECIGHGITREKGEKNDWEKIKNKDNLKIY